MRATIVFHHIGPYHETRARHASRFVDLSVVQWARKSTTYAWDECAHSDELRISTILDDPDLRTRRSTRATRFADAMKKTKPDVVFVNGWNDYGSTIAVQWCHRHGVPIVMMSESQEIDFPRKRLAEGVKRRIVRFCAAALCGGRTHAKYLQTLGMDGAQIVTGYDVVDNHYFAARASEARGRASELRGELGLPEHYALVCARFIAKKNLPFVLRAFARMRQKMRADDWKIALLGDGPMRSELEHLTRELAIDDFVLFPGFAQYDQIARYFGLASLLIHASTTEQWGLVVNEAMAAGLPVLVSDRCGSAAELVRDGVNGYQFDPTDEERFAEILGRMVTDPDRLARMGQESRRIIADWGPERFGRGVAEAAAMALRSPTPKVGLVDQMILSTLSYR